MLRQLAARDMAILIDLPALLLPRNGGGDDDDRGGGDGSEGAGGRRRRRRVGRLRPVAVPFRALCLFAHAKRGVRFFHDRAREQGAEGDGGVPRALRLLDELLGALMASRDILKLGFGAKQDLAVVRASWPALRGLDAVAALVEV